MVVANNCENYVYLQEGDFNNLGDTSNLNGKRDICHP